MIEENALVNFSQDNNLGRCLALFAVSGQQFFAGYYARYEPYCVSRCGAVLGRYGVRYVGVATGTIGDTVIKAIPPDSYQKDESTVEESEGNDEDVEGLPE